MDFLVAAFDGDVILWYENNGSQTFTEQTIASGINGPREVWPVDLDYDGDIDFLASIYFDQDLVWYENDGSQSFTKRTIDASVGGSANHCTAVDIDGYNGFIIIF